METKTIEVAEHTFLFVNEWKSKRNGFKHVSTLFVDGAEVLTETAHYINRTWESYQFQTAMRAVVYTLLEELKSTLIATYKEEHGVTRVSANLRKQIFEEQGQVETRVLGVSLRLHTLISLLNQL